MSAVAPIAAAVVRRQKQIVAQFRAAGATSADKAASVASLGVQEGMALRILRRHEILRDVGDRWYLDEARWEAHDARRRRLAIIIPSLFLLGVIVTLLILWL